MNETKIKQYTRSILKEHTDPLTGEINLTQVEEDVIDHFGLHERMETDADAYDQLSWWVFQVADSG